MNSKLKIVVTADPELPVPPRLYGGIERVIALLVDGLTSRGHDVTLFANPASRVDGHLVGYSGHRSGSKLDTMRNAAAIAAHVGKSSPDVVHGFGRLAYLLPILPMRMPKVMSYQRAVTPRSIAQSHRLAAGSSITYVGCSESLVKPVASMGNWRVVYNAVPLERYEFVGEVPTDAPLAFLGRLESIKGVHLAIDVARAARRRLVIAGNVPEGAAHQTYFHQQIQPHIDNQQVQYLGPVNDRQKNDLLGSAAALLMPILWDEPFGIVMAEALACGTPVIGLRRGSVPEVIRDGVTGFVCDDVETMAKTVARLSVLDRQDCRVDAERRFSQRALVDAYETLYAEVSQPLAGSRR